MSANLNVIPVISTGRLNTVNDAVIGGQAKLAGTSAFAGMLGARYALSQVNASLFSAPAVGTLYNGIYQYVQLHEDALDPAVGQGAFWKMDEAVGGFIITTDPTAPTPDGTNFAGVFIGTPTPGNYCWICVEGLVAVQLIASVTDTTIGSALVPSLVSSPGNHAMFNSIDDNSGAADNPNLNVGVAMQAPSNGALILGNIVCKNPRF